MDIVNTDDYETWHSLANQQQGAPIRFKTPPCLSHSYRRPELFRGLVQRNVDLETEINQLRDQVRARTALQSEKERKLT